MSMLSLQEIRSGLIIIFIALATAPAACHNEQPQISIEDARAVPSSILADEGLVYLKIRNNGGPDVIKGVRTSIPGAAASLHVMTEGFMKKADTIDIAGHTVMELKPDDSHIMIENMPQEAREGYQFTVTLVFERSGEKVLDLTFLKVRKPAMMMHDDGKTMTVTD